MARAWEAEFIRRWEAGETCAQIGAALGIPEGTASSRANTLRREGKIQRHPSGGRRQRALHNSAEYGAVQTTMHGAGTVQSSAEPPIPAAIAAEFMRLWAAIEALRDDLHPTVQSTVQSLPEPLFEDPADNATERWNLAFLEQRRNFGR